MKVLYLFVGYILFLKKIECSNVLYSTQISSTTSHVLELNEKNYLRFRCITHHNCTNKLFTLDSYCCLTTGYCCNWFEFVASFQELSKSNLPYKSPTLLTIITLLIILICFLFITYCFSILFCYCFKCGLFKKPNLIVITELSNSNNGSDSTSADLISPKYTSASSSSSSSASFSSSNESPLNRQNRPKNRSTSSTYLTKPKKQRHNQSFPSTKRNTRSPTARASSQMNSNRLYAKPECYVDCDTNESPFLIPQNVQKNKNQSKQSRRSNQYRAGYRNSFTTAAVPSAPPIRSNSITTRPISSAILETANDQRSETRTRSRSESVSSSLDFGASLMEAVESAAANSGINLNTVQPSAPSYYLDEKPPSYDDIIGK